MKSRAELADTISEISDASSPVGMDAVYVHALILRQLNDILERLDRLERRLDESPGESSSDKKADEPTGGADLPP